MVEMAGKEYLLKLRKERTTMRKEMVRLLTEKGTLSFQEIYLKMVEQYHKHCPFPYERDQILEGVVKNELAILVNRKELAELVIETGMGYCLAEDVRRQKAIHAA
jgi:hypothetical protein